MGTKVRVLVDCLGYKPDQVVDFPPSVAKQLAESGQVDPNKDAVNYCLKELNAAIVVHAESVPKDDTTPKEGTAL